MQLSEYENQIFLDAFHDDGLLVTAKGLGLERIFISFLKLYSDPGNLVIVVNTNAQEEEYFIEMLEQTGTKPLPKVITNEYSANEREAVYMTGGVLFITSRILVVDMLTDKLPIHLLTGILVYKAHKIIDSCQEAFILRLYRQKNKAGFVKAFSDNPQAFTAGFCHVERVMKSLFVRKLFLWPRFHATVVACLDKHKVDVVELELQMTSEMVACQTALLELISACVKELKRRNPTLETGEITVENALDRGLDTIVRLHLDPVWHQLGPVTRQLIADIKTLRLLLTYLTQYDCVNFYNLVQSIRTNEKAFGTNSGWLFMEAAESLFVHAKARLYKPAPKKKSSKVPDANSKPPDVLCLEECPKWKALKDVLDEIHGYMEEDGEDGGWDDSSRRVLVAAADDRTCSQLREYLCDGGKAMLERLFHKKAAMKAGAPQKQFKKKFSNKQQSDPAALTLTQMLGDPEESNQSVEDVPNQPFYTVMTTPITILHPLHGNTDPFSLTRSLTELKPRYVVLYDPKMEFVRQLEVYKTNHPSLALRVYFLMYGASTEEQRYLTSLRQEKEAFQYLIRERATMVIPEEREGKDEDDPNLARGTQVANETVNSRKGGQSETASQSSPSKVIVDMREFRSELPSLIHRRHIDVEPVTLEVGDYILTPDICVERKSLNDLIGSLNNGRLYNQAVSMCRYYTRPVLLIEFDANKSFALQGKYSIPNEINNTDTISRLTLLTLHFPRLRILWCQSPYATAELFSTLKNGRPEPDAAQAMAITDDSEEGVAMGKYNHGPQNLLLKMPGINSKNVFRVMNKVESLGELVTLAEADLSEILGSAIHARQLYAFLHAAHANTESSRPCSSTTYATNTHKRPHFRRPNFKHVKRKR